MTATGTAGMALEPVSPETGELRKNLQYPLFRDNCISRDHLTAGLHIDE